MWTILAIEILCAAQAIHLRAHPTGKGLQPVIQVLRRDVPPLAADRVVSTDIEKVRKLLRSGELLDAAEKAVGALA